MDQIDVVRQKLLRLVVGLPGRVRRMTFCILGMSGRVLGKIGFFTAIAGLAICDIFSRLRLQHTCDIDNPFCNRCILAATLA